MYTLRLNRILKLQETEGWSYEPFARGNSTSFYTEIIENNSITIAWVSIQNKISFKDLQLHHFKREINSETGIKNSLPRLLIVTDSKKWFLSKPGSQQFTQTKYSDLLLTLYNEIKETITNLEISEESISLQKNLTKSLGKIKDQIRFYCEKIREDKTEPKTDLFSGTGHFLVNPQNTELQHTIQLSDDDQLNRYSKILHQQLFRRLHPKQIQFLLQYPQQDIFANPFFKNNEFFVCVSKKSIQTLNDDDKHKATFLMIDQFADAKEYYPTAKILEQEILPTLLKIDRELVKKFLTKEAF